MPRDESTGLRAAQLRLGRLPGYVRQPDLARRNGEEGRTYKKGWEVRFTARTEEEIAEIRDLVVAAGFAPARPFFKGHQLIQPVYGIAAVQAYLAAREAIEGLARGRDSGPRIPDQCRAEPAQRTPAQRSRTERGRGDRGRAEREHRSAAAPAAAAAASSAAAAAALRARQAAEPAGRADAQVNGSAAGRTS
ncbi:hypothetical protein [Saccharothrix sp. ST-888]|uniref:hypothetical protein n=1 Tax=Saccharothrix sp. ST-888 TaxID=1427391 RepID=UPI0005ED2896|nr:hypothetical protein [Saccharothrix sp. ST-888]KJK58156.1 hypothetical protein UK12_12205 [Saccharothrix sp. ST-888]